VVGAEATLGEAEVEAAGEATSRRVVEAAAGAADVETSRQTAEAAAVAVVVVVAISPQTAEAAEVAVAVAVASSHPEAVGQWPFAVDRREVVVVLACGEEVPRRWLPEYTCMSPLLSGTHVTFNGISRSQCQYTNLDAVQTRSPLIRIPKSPNSKTPGLR
jgi:hypothetical protein